MAERSQGARQRRQPCLLCIADRQSAGARTEPERRLRTTVEAAKDYVGIHPPISLMRTRLAPISEVHGLNHWSLPSQAFRAATSGNDRTSATNFASNAEVLSFRHTRANGN